MKKKISILLMLVLTISMISGINANAATKVKYKNYTNARFNYQVKYPTKFTKKTFSDNGDGVTLTTKKKDATCLIWGGYNIMEDTGKTLLKSIKSYSPKLSSSTSNKKTCSYKYKKGKKIVYGYRYIVNDVVLGFEITYPTSQKSYYETAIKTIRSSMLKNKKVH
ncbi:hypothetical protein lbkm_3114 [Lachnospiraceae bacterium KM106-2]|nr:hypothetical protein lbkm_3114 [Lachnospiraceae bacterium KM106-2]